MDANFQELLDKGRVTICERHYKKEDIEYTPTGKKTVKLCALPTQNLPKPYRATSKGPPRRVLLRAVNEVDLPTYSPPLSSSTNFIAGYKDLKDMRTAISIMNSTDISLQEIDLETLTLKIYEKPYIVPKVEVVIDTTLDFTCLVFGFKVPDDHDIYKHYRRSLTKQALPKQKVSRYHPMIIRFCLSLASASAYDELRDSYVLTLPIRRTLRDYRHAIKPRVGFNPKVTAELCKLTSDLEGVRMFIVLSS